MIPLEETKKPYPHNWYNYSIKTSGLGSVKTNMESDTYGKRKSFAS